MSKDSETPPPGGQFLVYQAEDGKLKLDVRFEGETVWLTQQHMATLFQTTQQNISLHLQNIYAEAELQLEATHKESLSVRQEGTRSVRRRVDFYNLDAILSVGYRVKSAVATRFRIWATERLREYIVKGFLLDDERLKNRLNDRDILTLPSAFRKRWRRPERSWNTTGLRRSPPAPRVRWMPTLMRLRKM